MPEAPECWRDPGTPFILLARFVVSLSLQMLASFGEEIFDIVEVQEKAMAEADGVTGGGRGKRYSRSCAVG